MYGKEPGQSNINKRDQLGSGNVHFGLLRNVKYFLGYSTWWQISDKDWSYMNRCEIMVKIL